MEMYHESEREANDEPSIDLSYENGINNFMDTENYNENHQHAQDPKQNRFEESSMIP